jgi:DNA-binding PadR family transcriptional regulator
MEVLMTHFLTSAVQIVEEKHEPKIDRNISLAGLLVTDADTITGKLKREEKGLLKGLYVFKKKIPTGEVYICNGAEFPNSEAVDLLLYLIVQLEKNNWERKLRVKSLRELIREVYGITSGGKTWAERIRRSLVIWANHKYYFPKTFFWHGEVIEAFFGVIDSWGIKSQGRGRPAKIEISFNEKFIEICKNTDWYRRPRWLEVRRLRKEIAKSLYLLAYDYKPDERSKEWKIYINSDLKYWYRNALNSLANPKHLYPKLIIEGRLKPAIKEINSKTNLRMNLYCTEEGNYAISVEEVAPPGSGKIEIPFDKLPDEDKAILIAYLETVAEEKKIKNIWGFLRSMTSKQVESWLRKAKEYVESGIESDKETGLIEKPRLLEILRDWGKKKLEGKEILYRTYFGEDKILKAYENNRKVIFKCVDKIVADLLKKYSGELKEVFKKEVVFEEI